MSLPEVGPCLVAPPKNGNSGRPVQSAQTVRPSPPPVRRAVTAGREKGSRTLDYLFGEGWSRDTTYRADRPHTTEGPRQRDPAKLLLASLMGSQKSDRDAEREIVRKILSSEKWLSDPKSFLSCVARVSASLLPLAPAEKREKGALCPAPTVIPKKFWIYSETPLCQSLSPELVAAATFDTEQKMWRTKIFPSEKPSGRTEVVFLAHSMDQMLSTVDVSCLSRPEECYDPSNTVFTDVFKKLLSIYNIGFAEVTRHVYTQCVERGVLLDKIRGLYVDMAHNCFEVVTYLKKKLLAAVDVRKKTEHNLEKARGEATAAKYEVRVRDSELKGMASEVEGLNKRLRDQVTMELREELMKQFIQNQSERNALIIQLQESQKADRKASHLASPRSRRHEDAACDDDDDVRSFTEDGDPHIQVKQSEASTQTHGDNWDKPLYNALTQFCKSLKETSQLTEEATPMYSSVLFTSPLDSVRWADLKLQDVRAEINEQQNERRESGTETEEVTPANTVFNIPKKLVANALTDCNACLKEVNVRLNSHISSGMKMGSLPLSKVPTPSSSQPGSFRTVKDIPGVRSPRSSNLDLITTKMSLTPPDSHSICPLCMRPPLNSSAPEEKPLIQYANRPPCVSAEVQCDECNLTSFASLEKKMKGSERDLAKMSEGTDLLVKGWEEKVAEMQAKLKDLEREHRIAKKELRSCQERNSAISDGGFHPDVNWTDSDSEINGEDNVLHRTSSTQAATKARNSIMRDRSPSRKVHKVSIIPHDDLVPNPEDSARAPTKEAPAEDSIAIAISSPVLRDITSDTQVADVVDDDDVDPNEMHGVQEDLVVYLEGSQKLQRLKKTKASAQGTSTGKAATRRLSQQASAEEKLAEMEAFRQKRKEKQASERAALMTQIVNGSYQSKSLAWVLKQISQFYRAKAVSGMVTPFKKWAIKLKLGLNLVCF